MVDRGVKECCRNTRATALTVGSSQLVAFNIIDVKVLFYNTTNKGFGIESLLSKDAG